MERVRAFVALNLPLATVSRVAELQRELRAEAEAAAMTVAWVPPPNIHLTLRFLGEIPQESTYALRDGLTQELAGWSALELELRGVGVYPDAATPRVLWVGLQEVNGQLELLHQRVNKLIDALGFSPESRIFRPHITLGRIKAGHSPFWLARAQQPIDCCSARDVVLYRSELSPRGAQYTAISTVVLEA